jgi:hypothetical protein
MRVDRTRPTRSGVAMYDEIVGCASPALACSWLTQTPHSSRSAIGCNCANSPRGSVMPRDAGLGAAVQQRDGGARGVPVRAGAGPCRSLGRGDPVERAGQGDGHVTLLPLFAYHRKSPPTGVNRAAS